MQRDEVKVYLRYLLLVALATVGGVLGNLVATIIENSFFQLTPFAIIATITGAVISIPLLAYLEWWPLKNRIPQKLAELEYYRAELRKLRLIYESDDLFTSSHARIWREHQFRINTIKEELSDRQIKFSFDIIDDYPTPKVGCLIRFIEAIKGLLPTILIILSVGFSLALAPTVQRLYINVITMPEITPEPDSTPTPSGTPTLNSESQATLEGLNEALTSAANAQTSSALLNSITNLQTASAFTAPTLPTTNPDILTSVARYEEMEELLTRIGPIPTPFPSFTVP